MLRTLAENVGKTNFPTLAIGVAATAFLFCVRKGLKPLLIRLGVAPRLADLTAKAGPIFAVAMPTLAVLAFDLETKGVKVIGEIPRKAVPDFMRRPRLLRRHIRGPTLITADYLPQLAVGEGNAALCAKNGGFFRKWKPPYGVGQGRVRT